MIAQRRQGVEAVVLTRHHLIVALVLVAVVVAAVVVDRLVVTERERIEGVIEDMASAAEQSDAAALFEHVSRDYRAEGMPLTSLRMLVEMFFRTYGPVRVNVRETRVTREGNLATVSVAVSAVSEARADVYGRSVWDLSMRKEADGAWRVTRIVPVRIRGRDVSGWEEVSGACFVGNDNMFVRKGDHEHRTSNTQHRTSRERQFNVGRSMLDVRCSRRRGAKHMARLWLRPGSALGSLQADLEGAGRSGS